MDKPIVFVRVLGSSPESSMEDVKGVMSQYGEVLEVRKGKLSRKLPHVTNGTWTVRMIVGENKIIPSFVFVNDDGEIWQLAHDNQETICWQCGQQGHIGSRCRQEAVSIEHDLLPPVDPTVQPGEVAAVPVQTWAHVVRGVAVHQPVDRREDEAATLREEAAAAARRKDELAAAEREEEIAARSEEDRVAASGKKDVAAAKEIEAGGRRDGDNAAALREEDDVTTRREGNVAATEGEKDEVTTRREGNVAATEGEEDMVVDEGEENIAPTARMNTFTASSVTADVPPGSVKITTPTDSILNPAKFAKLPSGPVIPSCSVNLLSGSPELTHKLAHVTPTQWEISSSPGSSSGTQSGDSLPFSDPGSSNAMRPGSGSLDLK